MLRLLNFVCKPLPGRLGVSDPLFSVLHQLMHGALCLNLPFGGVLGSGSVLYGLIQLPTGFT
ncbi:MAG: hypothetical protein VX938_03365, partial [Myxococcota bacterium]|nr:hypothetical protein [Myxococcota bacterium]